jgi:hypothetical protein
MNETCNSAVDCMTGLSCVKGLCQCGPGMEETAVRVMGPDGRQFPCRPRKNTNYCSAERQTNGGILVPQIVGQPCTKSCHDPLVCDAETKMCACPEGYTIRQQGIQRVCFRGTQCDANILPMLLNAPFFQSAQITRYSTFT